MYVTASVVSMFDCSSLLSKIIRGYVHITKDSILFYFIVNIVLFIIVIADLYP
jgi:hypothetical protein